MNDPGAGTDPSILDDNLLVDALSGPGWSDALGTLWTRHMGVLWNTARAMTRNDDDAADAISDAFMALATRAADGRLEVRVSFRALAVTTVRNTVIGRYRKTHREDITAEPLDQTVEDGDALPDDRFVAGGDAAMMAAAFASLPERSRTVLWLTEVEGLAPREVAEAVGLSANNVAQIAVRSRRSLRTAWVERHLTRVPVDPVCAEMQQLLPAAITNDLSDTARTRLDAHLEGCEPCRDVRAELSDDTMALRGLIIPPLVGLVGLGAWLANAKTAGAVTVDAGRAGAGPGTTTPGSTTGAKCGHALRVAAKRAAGAPRWAKLVAGIAAAGVAAGGIVLVAGPGRGAAPSQEVSGPAGQQSSAGAPRPGGATPNAGVASPRRQQAMLIDGQNDVGPTAAPRSRTVRANVSCAAKSCALTAPQLLSDSVTFPDGSTGPVAARGTVDLYRSCRALSDGRQSISTVLAPDDSNCQSYRAQGIVAVPVTRCIPPGLPASEDPTTLTRLRPGGTATVPVRVVSLAKPDSEAVFMFTLEYDCTGQQVMVRSCGGLQCIMTPDGSGIQASIGDHTAWLQVDTGGKATAVPGASGPIATTPR